MNFKTGTTNGQKVQILLSELSSKEERISKLKSMLAEKEINPLEYEQLGKTCMKFYQALMTIKIVCNPATQAWEIAESALRDE